MKVPRRDLTGMVFGRLTVREFSHYHIQPSGQQKGFWSCVCSCGNEKSVSQSNLLRNHTLSCGCLFVETMTTHGMTNTFEYRSYHDMKARCTNPSDTGFDYYGGRGIKVSEDWLESFDNFYRDMGPAPEGFSLERINVDGDYCRENCIWDSKSNQSYNTRIKSHNTSGRTGVGWDDRKRKWIAQIGYNSEVIYLGQFDNFEDAVEVRERAELKYFGRIKQ